ncbi:hypothetical protein FA15DRAFT_660682 [Coprinopsis marcescibilis]|uniref:Uncharacterized protein n=1 Tax=Coprinopsis marcescibilis TaxID=230819 RepID=A0A5C3KFF3_COPMA|nr:hypothetical protein FA15DRAFT_660682 [Coprinopsis marcescibilis]
MSVGSKRQDKQVHNRWQLGQVLQQTQRAQWARQAAIGMGGDGVVGGGHLQQAQRAGERAAVASRTSTAQQARMGMKDREACGSCNEHEGQLGRGRWPVAPVTSTKGDEREGQEARQARAAPATSKKGRRQAAPAKGAKGVKGREHARRHLQQAQWARAGGEAGGSCDEREGQGSARQAAPAMSAKGGEARGGRGRAATATSGAGTRVGEPQAQAGGEGARGGEGAMSAVVACPGVEQQGDEEAQLKWEQGGNREREERLMGGLFHDLFLCMAAARPLYSSHTPAARLWHGLCMAAAPEPYQSCTPATWLWHGLHTAAAPEPCQSRVKAAPAPYQGRTAAVRPLQGPVGEGKVLKESLILATRALLHGSVGVWWCRGLEKKTEKRTHAPAFLASEVLPNPHAKVGVWMLWDRTVCIWDAKTGQQVGEPLQGHTDKVNSVVFSPDGRRIVLDHMAKLSEFGTWRRARKPLQGHTKTGKEAAAGTHKLGYLIASGSFDETVWIWDSKLALSADLVDD